MKPWMIWLAAFLVTAASASTSRSTQAEDQQRNQLLWLKRLVGTSMLLVAGVYAYFIYRVQEQGGWGPQVAVSIFRGAGWLLWGLGLVTRIKIADQSTLEKIYKAWSNQRRSFLAWAGFLVIAVHTGYLVSEYGIDAFRVDAIYVQECLAALTSGTS